MIDLPNAQIQNIKGRDYGLAISPNNEWLFFANENWVDFASGSHKEGLKFEPDSFYVENGEMMKGIQAHTFFLYNRITSERFNLGARYKKYLLLNSSDKKFPGGGSFSIRETGVWYYVLKWTDNNEVYLLEQTKEEKIFKASQSELYPSMSSTFFESPYATAKIVKLSLDDMTIEDTEYEPKRAWVSYADHTTGVIGYTSPEDVIPHNPISKGSRLPLYDQTPKRTTWLSNFEGTKQYAVANLDIPAHGSFNIISSGYLNDKLYTIIGVMLSSNKRHIDYGDGQIGTVEADSIYALEMDTGKFIKIVDIEEMYSVAKTYYSSLVGGKIYFTALKMTTPFEPTLEYLAYIGEDMKMHILNEMNRDAYIKYFRKRGGNNE